MNLNDGLNSTKQHNLVFRLCTYMANNKPVVSANLYKIAFNTLTTAATMDSIVPHGDHYVLMQIRQSLKSKSKLTQERFELLYSNLCEENSLQSRCGVLWLLLKLAQNPRKSSLVDIVKLENLNLDDHLQSLKTSTSGDSLCSIFQGRNSVKTDSSMTNLMGSRITSASSSSWSRHDLETVSTKHQLNSNFITESEILQDIIYSFQGIEGRFLRKEPGGLGFHIDTKYSKNLSPIQRGVVDRLIGMSFLHNQLKQYCENNYEQGGAICMALTATLRDELSAYYKTIALLQTYVKKHSENHPLMTLRKALVYIHDHRERFEWLAYIAEQCSEKKGGALVSTVYGFLQHGSKCAQEVSEMVLAAVCKPLYTMLSRWLLDGEINDPNCEFFIEARDITAAERLWYDKYHVRKSMIPTFITIEQAKKILATGKGINFLRQICKENGPLPGRDALQKLVRTGSAESLFTAQQSLEFDSILDKVYRETSLRVVDLLKNKHRLLEHLQALRGYLLLGQGDFIRHLLELLVPELNKPAQDIYGHTLSAILESAIRVTNAQYEDEDTLQRLNVSFMGHSQGDNGWDVFSLIYAVDGPVGTIFQPSMSVYQCLFGALWKAKRMEFVLANMRKQQLSMGKKFRSIKELKPVTHVIHILTSEMIHFLHQTQYYFLFEVLECSWAEMLKKVNHAECLDDIITAHTAFLNSVQSGVLLDENSRVLFSQLRSIYNVVLTLEAYQKDLNETANDEYEKLLQYEKLIEIGFGLTADLEIAVKIRVETFRQKISSIRTQVRNLAQTYEQFVKKYLGLLSSSSNINLQLLSVRLSFNNYYKII